ncbi:glycoside hydrolase family 125 protein [Schleiferilactobacillus perolens]|jgi:meiotically up-regulated gene 157 (Mug157) protein|uniref:glycoside hydrolase family 125 protein n=1 Tax=Schleiferilactobacillus perolens TaxID=100468 RepID=UPI00235623EE|nr:glycoside hydrolase family 125 protein [Schleiferilactobacillus perolens]MCI2171391.1 glycoside hydrolase family 125 protein [Schleiferilactobacillus perolens]
MINLKTVEKKLDDYAAQQTLPSKRATQLFRHVLNDVIAKATTANLDGTFFVATGDIPAMWLRDATFQILPYLSLADEIPELRTIAKGVLRQELIYVQHDPYANAFNQTASDAHWAEDESNIPISPFVWERKFEVDSLCAPLFLATALHQQDPTDDFLDDEFWSTLAVILGVFQQEQHHGDSPYFFNRSTGPASDTLKNHGRGTEVGDTGMIWSGFRPSDDACQYGYLVPSNMFAVSVLRDLLPLIPDNQQTLRQDTAKLIEEVTAGIQEYGVVTLPTGQKGYAYEVDGLGHVNLMDDANVPSLLSQPFLGYTTPDDPLYQNTRAFILSTQNPYYYSGRILEGIGSAHTPANYVWPISLAMEGLTSTDPLVQAARLEAIALTDNRTQQCHEGVNVDDPRQFTREWFSWSNMTFCQLALKLLSAQSA